MLITANQILAHGIGDYIFQSDWMAAEKTKRHLPALLHVLTYILPFLFLTQSWKALALIAGTHFLIDRYRLARYPIWFRNWFGPKWLTREIEVPNVLAGTSQGVQVLHMAKVQKPVRNFPWSECSGTGFPSNKPQWLAVWLLIITDNCFHVLLNGLILQYLG